MKKRGNIRFQLQLCSVVLCGARSQSVIQLSLLLSAGDQIQVFYKTNVNVFIMFSLIWPHSLASHATGHPGTAGTLLLHLRLPVHAGQNEQPHLLHPDIFRHCKFMVNIFSALSRGGSILIRYFYFAKNKILHRRLFTIYAGISPKKMYLKKSCVKYAFNAILSHFRPCFF